MKPSESSLIKKAIKISIFGLLCSQTNIVFAQITSDNTVNSQVIQNGNVAEITGGETRGNHVFHSFSEFSVRTGSEAFFNNVETISSIFSRVTGGDISNINGSIRANGNASLFLINPAGIIFGKNASLDIGGSFYGSTADSILFEEGEFSATTLDTPPLLTINAPIGFSFRDNPKDIINRSNFNLRETVLDATTDRIFEVEEPLFAASPYTFRNATGLEVPSGQSLNLIGGNIILEEAAGLTAPGGSVRLSGLSQAGVVTINNDGSLAFPAAIEKANVSLTEQSRVNVAANGSGSINIAAKNLLLSGGSELRAGIAEDMVSDTAQAGNITIDATDSVTLIGNRIPDNSSLGIEELDTALRNHVGLPKILREDFGEASSAVGSSGSIFIDTNRLEINSKANTSAKVYGIGNAGNVNLTAQTITLDAGAILSQIPLGGEGNAGNINLDTKALTASNLAFIIANHLGEGIGNAGNINLDATEAVVLGDDSTFNAFITELGEGVEGKAGDINITTNSLTIDASGAGGSQLLTISKGNGDAGNVNINAEDINLFGRADILSQVDSNTIGNAGDINITTNSLEVRGDFTTGLDRKSVIQASSAGLGNGGNIAVDASERILLENASILSQVTEAGTGDAGTINLNTPSLTLNDFSLVDNGIIGRGSGGSINIDTETLSVNNFSILSSNARENAIGTGGNIVINSNEIEIANGAVISAFTENESDGGSIAINANSLLMGSGGKIVTQTDGSGDAGDTTLNITEEVLINGDNPARSGELEPFADDLLIRLEPETGLFADASDNSTGDGGSITVFASNLLLNSGSVSAETQAGDGGNITLEIAEEFTLQNGSIISAAALNNASGGNVNINARFIVAFPDGDNDILASASQGMGGNINLDARSLFGIKERPQNSLTNDIDASSEFGLDGNISINAPDADAIEAKIELPSNPIETQQTVVQACKSDRLAGKASGLTILGKGGIPAKPTEPLEADLMLVEGTIANSTQQVRHPDIETISTQYGNIVPAMGIVKTEDGRVILSAHPTDNIDTRNINNSRNCDRG